jgi:hypothetical protein
MRLLRRLLRLKILAALVAALATGAGGTPSPPTPAPAEYVPGPDNPFVPKPSCATLVDPSDKRPPWTRWLAACATTHGLVVRGPYRTERKAMAVANAIYDAERDAQGGRLLR